MPGSDMEQLHAIVHGHVQGVSFRYYTAQQALRLGVTGWVQNQRNGTVEVCAEGPRRQLDQLCAFLHHGPPAAVVHQVDIRWLPASGRFDTFTVRHTGAD